MKKSIYFGFACLICFTLAIQKTSAQYQCATPGNIPDRLGAIPAGSRVAPLNAYVVRVYVHTIRRTNGTGGLTTTEINQALNRLSLDLSPHNICISVMGRNEIRDDNYYNNYVTFPVDNFGGDANNDGKFDNFNVNSHANAIDLYLFPADGGLQGGTSVFFGKAVAVGGVEGAIRLASSYVLSHEFGHCLGLYHTFQGLCDGGCPELVNGSNCSSCGDFVCDTRADPSIFNVASPACTWNGTRCAGVGATDANGQTYNPQTDVIMDYVTPACFQRFTNGQGERMRSVLANVVALFPVVVPASITLSSLNVTSGQNTLYDVTGTITTQTSVVVQAGGSLTLRAYDEILLKDVFSANTSSNFLAVIDEACSTLDPNNSARTGGGQDTNGFKPPSKALAFSGFDFTIAPNPARNSLLISLMNAKEGSYEIRIVSIDGKILQQTRLSIPSLIDYQIPRNIEMLNAGTYLVQIITKDRIQTKKFIKVY